MKSPKLYKLSQARKDLPKRSSADNKTRGGKCLIIAGSKGMAGAAVFAATAAARCGAGYVYLASEDKTFSALNHPDFLEFPLKPAKDLSMFSAIAIGPGLSNSKLIVTWLKHLAEIQFANVVIDASALNVLAENKINLLPTWILTPHEGELSRLIKKPSDVIRANRASALQEAQEKFGCVILLKGHHTLIMSAEAFTKNTSGNAALAKAGTGDILTGIITGLLSQQVPAFKAASLGSFIHGYMADQWLKSKKDILSLMASDLLTLLPTSLFKLRRR